jgi:DNA primase large subunit
MGTLAPDPLARYHWWFHQSPAVLVSAWTGKHGQPNLFADAVQLELDCLRRTEQLLAAHDAMPLPSCRPKITAEQASADRVAAFMVHQALASDASVDARGIVRLETDLFLLRTRNEDQMGLFALFGKKCVPMRHALQRAGAWDDDSCQPNAEIARDIEAMMHVKPGGYNRHSWQHFFAATFETAAPLLATRKVLLRCGIAFFHADGMQAILRHLCAVSLQRYMSQVQHVLFDPDNEQFAHIARISAQILARLRAKGARPVRAAVTSALVEDLRPYAIVDTLLLHAPLCIRALLAKLKLSRDRHVSHGLKNDERYVLSTFLQTVGAERHGILELFAKLSGLDDGSFHTKYGRDIEWRYDKQSNCFGCAKIQEKGLCPFQDKKRALQVLKTASPNDTHPVDIEECFRSAPAEPSAACAAFYARRHGPRKRVFNPRSYFLDAHAAKRPRMEKPPPAASRMPATAARRARIQRVAQGLLPGR